MGMPPAPVPPAPLLPRDIKKTKKTKNKIKKTIWPTAREAKGNRCVSRLDVQALSGELDASADQHVELPARRQLEVPGRC